MVTVVSTRVLIMIVLQFTMVASRRTRARLNFMRHTPLRSSGHRMRLLRFRRLRQLDRAYGTVDRDHLPGGDCGGGIAHADDGGNAVLTGDCRTVRHRRSRFGDEARGSHEQRGPAGTGGRGGGGFAW